MSAPKKKTFDVFGGEGIDSPEEELCLTESQNEMGKCQAYLDSLNPDIRSALKAKNLSRILLETEHHKIEKLSHDGLLTSKEAEIMMQQVTRDLHHMSVDRKRTSRVVAHNHTLAQKFERLSSEAWIRTHQSEATAVTHRVEEVEMSYFGHHGTGGLLGRISKLEAEVQIPYQARHGTMTHRVEALELQVFGKNNKAKKPVAYENTENKL